MRVNHVIPEIKEKLDIGEMLLTAAVQLSYLPEQGQRIALKVADESDIKLTEKVASKIRSAPMTEKDIREAVAGVQPELHPLGIAEEEKLIFKPIKLSAKFSMSRLLDATEKACVANLTEQVKAYAANYNASALIANEEVPFVDADSGEVVEALN